MAEPIGNHIGVYVYRGPAGEVLSRFTKASTSLGTLELERARRCPRPSYQWPQSASLPSSPVLVRPSHWQDSYEVFNEMPKDGGSMPQSWAELNHGSDDVVGHVGQLTFWDPGMLSRTAWLVAIALIPVGLAWLWWTLSRMVGSARRGDPFTHRNARRLAVAGALVALGPTLALLAQQAVLRWMLAGSTAAGKADIWFRWESVPLWPLGVGLALLVLAAVWRHGVAMREDLEGLV